MKVTAARFLGAAAKPGGAPPPAGPEIAFAGRSNVGKSSLLNAFIGRHGIARTSATPGRTRQINFFLINERIVFADLPGYGFAVGPEAERLAWGPLIEGYLRERPTLRGVVVIVDVRRGPEAEEDQLLDFLEHVGLPAVIVATKVDKLGRGAARTAIDRLGVGRSDRLQVIGFSARTGEGKDALWKVVRGWLDAPVRDKDDARRQR